MKYQLTELAEHPDNNQIYSSTDLEELKNSLLIHGQLEPLVINKDKVIISGHRRFNAMQELKNLKVMSLH
jgi:ParB-like chromosome segregation protein Spo0J